MSCVTETDNTIGQLLETPFGHIGKTWPSTTPPVSVGSGTCIQPSNDHISSSLDDNGRNSHQRITMN